jgi:hypothetical protein
MRVAGVNDLERPDPGTDQAKTYALLVADTYLIPGEDKEDKKEEEKKTECLTSAAPKNWTDVAYYFKVRRIWPSSCSMWLAKCRAVLR